MADTTIKVESAVWDRLAVLAAERGVTIRDLAEELARATPTRQDLETRHAAAMAYLREQVCPDLAGAISGRVSGSGEQPGRYVYP